MRKRRPRKTDSTFNGLIPDQYHSQISAARRTPHPENNQRASKISHKRQPSLDYYSEM